MKYNFKNLLALSALLILVASCSKKIDEAYKNPNYDVKVAPETLMPQIVASMAGNYGGHGPMHDIRYIGAYTSSCVSYLNVIKSVLKASFKITSPW